MQIDIKVPTLIFAYDYHLFLHYQDVLKTINPKLRCVEVDSPSPYWGVIYYGKKPSKAEIKQLLAKEGVE